MCLPMRAWRIPDCHHNYINPVFIPELGPEGNNGAVYTPAPGAPGSIAGAVVTYNIISDSPIPEPGALALTILGAGTLLFILKRRTCSQVN